MRINKKLVEKEEASKKGLSMPEIHMPEIPYVVLPIVLTVGYALYLEFGLYLITRPDSANMSAFWAINLTIATLVLPVPVLIAWNTWYNRRRDSRRYR